MRDNTMNKLSILIIGIISLISLINSIIKKAREKERNARRGDIAPAQQQKVQSEIDAFLSEVGVRPSGAPPKTLVAQPGPPPQRRKKQARPAARKEQPRRHMATKLSQQQSLGAARHSVVHKVGSGISEHVETFIAEHVTGHLDHGVDETVQADIVQSVKRHLGVRSEEMSALTGNAQVTSLAAEFRELLQSPEGIRRAIILNEVLRRSPALRR